MLARDQPTLPVLGLPIGKVGRLAEYGCQSGEIRDPTDQLEQAIQNADRETYLAITQAIHALEAKAAHNRCLQRQIETIHSLSHRFRCSFIADTESFSKAAAHAATLGAIESHLSAKTEPQANSQALSHARLCGQSQTAKTGSIGPLHASTTLTLHNEF
jgi:phage shock protein A